MNSDTTFNPSLALVVLGLFFSFCVISLLFARRRASMMLAGMYVLMLSLLAINYSGIPGFALTASDMSLVLALGALRGDEKAHSILKMSISAMVIGMHVALVFLPGIGRPLHLVLAIVAPILRMWTYGTHIVQNALVARGRFGSVFAMKRDDFLPFSWFRLLGAMGCIVLSVLSFLSGLAWAACSCVLLACVMALDMLDARQPSHDVMPSDVDKPIANTKREEMRARMMELLRGGAYLDPDFSLLTLSRSLGTNQSYVSNLLNNDLGVTFPELRNRLRINYAKHLIEQDPSMKVEQISMACGYGTLVTFQREFKKRTHQSPSEYMRGMKAMRALGRTPCPSTSLEPELLCAPRSSSRDEGK